MVWICIIQQKVAAYKPGWSTVTFKIWVYGKNASMMQDSVTMMADCPAFEKEIIEKVKEIRKSLQGL